MRHKGLLERIDTEQRHDLALLDAAVQQAIDERNAGVTPDVPMADTFTAEDLFRLLLAPQYLSRWNFVFENGSDGVTLVLRGATEKTLQEWGYE